MDEKQLYMILIKVSFPLLIILFSKAFFNFKSYSIHLMYCTSILVEITWQNAEEMAHHNKEQQWIPVKNSDIFFFAQNQLWSNQRNSTLKL